MVELTNDSLRVVVNPEGAWVEEFSTNGLPVFFPRTQLASDSGEQKTRGGMHVCLPNFGPSTSHNLPQHGFGRTSTWKVTRQSSRSVELRLLNPPVNYEALESSLVYTLEDGLEATLTLRNQGRTSLRVAPGFHPYFFLEESETAVLVNDTVYKLAELGGTEFTSSKKASLKTANYEIEINQNNLETWAIWTDQLANYVCVEPTYGGNRFLETSSPDEFITPGEEKSFNCLIRP